MKMKRRVIPPAAAIVAGIATGVPAVYNWISESHWLAWSLLILAILFAFKAGLFYWMRLTMVDTARRLTTFGYALTDFFLAVVIGDIGLVVLFLTTYWYVVSGELTAPFLVRVADRSILVAGSVFVIATGVAVAFEMQEARGNVRVHEDQGGEPWHSSQ